MKLKSDDQQSHKGPEDSKNNEKECTNVHNYVDEEGGSVDSFELAGFKVDYGSEESDGESNNK